MTTKWIVAIDVPYYPFIEEFDTEEEALASFERRLQYPERGQRTYLAKVEREERTPK